MSDYLEFIGHQIHLAMVDLCNTNLNGEIGIGIFLNIPKNYCHPRQLDLSGYELSSEVSVYFQKFIGNQTQLVELGLCYTDLSAKKGKGILENIPADCCDCQQLRFSRREFSGDKSIYLGDFIGNQVHLLQLDLNGTNLSKNIGTGILRKISTKYCNLQQFDLSRCIFSNDTSLYLGKFSFIHFK